LPFCFTRVMCFLSYNILAHTVLSRMRQQLGTDYWYILVVLTLSL
jgi:hypothetical protein